MKVHKRSQSPMALKVAKLWTSPEGTTEKIALDAKLEYPGGEIVPASNLTGRLMLIKMKDEISVIISDAEIKLKFVCNRCLGEFITTVKIPGAEREFLARKPAVADDLSDIFLIDMKDLVIDLSEMVRQEIILHFPFIPVCSNSCKGLCPVCGRNRNKRPCGCRQEDAETFRPFKDLKKILKGE